MHTITKKSEIGTAVAHSVAAYHEGGLDACTAAIKAGMLDAKVRFPLLEYAAMELVARLPEDAQRALCDRIVALHTEGGNVLLGIFLQQWLDRDFDLAVQKAAAYIEFGAEWYVCDIIGERVFGVGLLRFPERMLQALGQLAAHPSHWVRRAIGPGAHYAIKKGLPKPYVEAVFQLLLSMGGTMDFHVRQGIGWAAKTTAKFHPDLIEAHADAIADPVRVGNWFRAKVKIGLERHAYAKGNRR